MELDYDKVNKLMNKYIENKSYYFLEKITQRLNKINTYKDNIQTNENLLYKMTWSDDRLSKNECLCDHCYGNHIAQINNRNDDMCNCKHCIDEYMKSRVTVINKDLNPVPTSINLKD